MLRPEQSPRRSAGSRNGPRQSWRVARVYRASARAIARFHLPDDARICNLDDPVVLHTLGLRPSDIVSRDYTSSRAWAQRIYEQGGWFGVRWWSYYDSQWASFGLWNFGQIKLEEVKLLRLDAPAFLDASRTIARRIVTHPDKT